MVYLSLKLIDGLVNATGLAILQAVLAFHLELYILALFSLVWCLVQHLTM